jgi:DNA-binding winged helix-turn-helix (wHTH) protein/tetratricopeptide (TPR) repeat protein
MEDYTAAPAGSLEIFLGFSLDFPGMMSREPPHSASREAAVAPSHRRGTMVYVFGVYTLDTQRYEVRRGGQPVHVRRKVFQMLAYLLAQRERVVPKQELCEQLWPEQFISDATLDDCLAEARRAVGDSGRAQQVIKTLHGQGYRFVAPLTIQDPASAPGGVPLPHRAIPETTGRRAPTLPRVADAVQVPASDPPFLVGRDAELAHLHQCFAQAHAGQRQLVVLLGEPGIGKTALVDAFLHQVASCSPRPDAGSGAVCTSPPPALTPSPWIGRGQCIEHFGAGEAYLPILEALGRLARTAGGDVLKSILQRYAPTWLVQLPALCSADELAEAQRRILRATPGRMLRELVEAIEALTTDQTLILVIEDLHWSDPSTVALVSMLAQRPEPARFLLLGTSRDTEADIGALPLRAAVQELRAHDRCHLLELRLLTATDVATYLAAHLPGRGLPPRLSQVLYERTEGNPFFRVSLLQDLLARGVLREDDGAWSFQAEAATLPRTIPASIHALVAAQRTRLSPHDQRLLQAASVAGFEFSAAALAAAVQQDPVDIEERCAPLVERRQFLRPVGISEWPDGTRAARYGFLHALYQEIWHEQVSVGRHQQWHLRLGERKEAAYGDRASDIAAELAVHFAQGREYARAVPYLQQAADNAVHCHAYPKTLALLTQGLELLAHLPDTAARWRHEFSLRMRLSSVLMTTQGYAAPEVETALTRALALSQQLGDERYRLQVLLALAGFYLFRGDLRQARTCAEQSLALGQQTHRPNALLWTHYLLSVILHAAGEFVAARTHLAEATTLADRQPPETHTFRGVEEPGVRCHVDLGLVLWCLGYPDQALAQSRAALALAHQLAYPLNLVSTWHSSGILHQLRGEPARTREHAEALLALATAHDMAPPRVAGGLLLRGWTLAAQGDRAAGLAAMHQGLTLWASAGSRILRPYALATLGEVYRQGGQPARGLARVQEALALVQTTGERWYEAELHRLHGELTLAQAGGPGREAEAEACFHTALEIARRQQARSWELRTAMSLARLWQGQGKPEAARQLLAPIYGWFSEGFDTADLQEAQALLAACA